MVLVINLDSLSSTREREDPGWAVSPPKITKSYYIRHRVAEREISKKKELLKERKGPQAISRVRMGR